MWSSWVCLWCLGISVLGWWDRAVNGGIWSGLARGESPIRADLLCFFILSLFQFKRCICLCWSVMYLFLRISQVEVAEEKQRMGVHCWSSEDNGKENFKQKAKEQIEMVFLGWTRAHFTCFREQSISSFNSICLFKFFLILLFLWDEWILVIYHFFFCPW